jgi:glycosyltransferase involved in cell wall biosynthesis
MQMKIGISSNALKLSGGLERYAMDLVRGLSDAGFAGEHKPVFFARKIDPSLPESRLVDARRINVSWLPSRLRDSYFSWALRRARGKAAVDVLIGCNRVDSSEIAICGGTHIGFLRATGRREKRSDSHQIALERRQYRDSQVIVAHSDMMRDELKSLYGIDETRIRVLYPPVDGARFSPVPADTRARLRKQFGFADHETVLLFPSSSHERKGLPLIEAALRESGLPVVVAVAGRAPESTTDKLRYIGYAQNIEDCYRAADFTVLASTYEPFGMVGIESVMCGTPVIFPTSIGCCDVIASHAKCTFAPGDVDDLRRAIRRAIENRVAVSREDILYDPGIAVHVEQILVLAKRINAAGSTARA